MHYIKPVRVTLACLNILFDSPPTPPCEGGEMDGREWLRLFPPFFCVFTPPLPLPLKGRGTSGKPRRRKRTKVDKYQKIWIKVRSLV